MKYIKKPVVIEAIQWKGNNFVEIDNFITIEHETYPSQGIVIIPTLEGIHEASLNDYIIKGVKGEFYPCKPDIFEITYEPVEEKPVVIHFDGEAIANAVMRKINERNKRIGDFI